MNRSERRAGKWSKLVPHKDYDGFIQEAGPDAVAVMMAMLRELAGPVSRLDDRTLWNSTRELINAGLLNVWFRYDGKGVEVRPEFLSRPVNDNDPWFGGAA